MLRMTLALALAGLAVVPALPAQIKPIGERVVDGRYHSPEGTYSVAIPVLPELGGRVDESEYVVTFQDSFTLHASIACFPMDATQRWENETRGRRDYLVWFFGSFVQGDFETRFPGSHIESAKFLQGVQDGALLVYNLLPGGTMFPERAAFIAGEDIPVAKRGNLLFVRNNHVYVLSIELAEKVIERRTYGKTIEEEDQILQTRLMDLLNKMSFSP